jgi:hypothetical protein
MEAFSQLMRSPNMRVLAYTGATHQMRLSIRMITRSASVFFADSEQEALAILQRLRAEDLASGSN